MMDHLIDDSYVARGLGLITATVGRQTEFYLYSKYDGNEFGNIEIELRGRNGETGKTTVQPGGRTDAAAAECSKSIAVDCAHDGDRIRVTYTPCAEGVHVLTLSRDGLPICRSPYYVSVERSASRSRIRLCAAKKYNRMATAKFGKGKCAPSGEFNAIRANDPGRRRANRRGSDENDYRDSGPTGTDVMSMVTKFESNGGVAGGLVKAGRTARARAAADTSGRNADGNGSVDGGRTDSGVPQSPSGFVVNKTRAKNDDDNRYCNDGIARETHSEFKNARSSIRPGRGVNGRENSTFRDRNSEDGDGNANRFDETIGRDDVVDRASGTNGSAAVGGQNEPGANATDRNGRTTAISTENTIVQSVSNGNDFAHDARLVTAADSSPRSDVNALFENIVAKLTNRMCEKCSEQMRETLSAELSRDTNVTPSSNDVPPSPEPSALFPRPICRWRNVDVHDDVISTEHRNKRFDNSTKPVDRVDDAIDENRTLDGNERVNDNSEGLYSDSGNTRSMESITNGQNNVHDNENTSREISEESITEETARETVLQNCSTTKHEEHYVNSECTIVNGDDDSENDVECVGQSISYKSAEHNVDSIKPNRCDGNIDSVMIDRVDKENVSALDKNYYLLVLNVAENANGPSNTDESKCAKNKTIPNEKSKSQCYVIDDTVLDSINVTLMNSERQICDIFNTDDGQSIRSLTAIRDVNQKSIIEKSIERELNSFKNNIVERISLLCLNKDSLNTHCTRLFENRDTTSISDSRETQIHRNTNSAEFPYTENENKQTEINGILTAQIERQIDKHDSSETVSATKTTDSLLKCMKNIICPSENHNESIMEVEKIMSTTKHHFHDQQQDFVDENQKNNYLTLSTVFETTKNNEPLEDVRKDSKVDEPNNGQISKDVKSTLEETPVVLKLQSTPASKILDYTEPNDQDLRTKRKVSSSNTTETVIVKNINTIQQEAKFNSPVLNVSETLAIESNDQNLNDFKTAAIELKPSLTKLLNVSRLATLKKLNPKEMNTNTTKRDHVEKLNTVDTKTTSEASTSVNNNNRKTVINKSNSTEIENINETVEYPNEFETKVWSAITPISNDTRTIVIQIPNMFELKTTTKILISNNLQNIEVEQNNTKEIETLPIANKKNYAKSVTIGRETRLKLSSLNDVTVIVIIERSNSDEIKTTSNTLVSNRPTIITIEIESASDAKSSNANIIHTVKQSNTEVIKNKSNITTLNPSYITDTLKEHHIVKIETFKESYDTTNKTVEIDATSDNLVLNSNVPVKETTGINIESLNQINHSNLDILTDIPEGVELDALKNSEPKSFAIELVEGKKINDAPVNVITNSAPEEMENKIAIKSEPVTSLNNTNVVTLENLNTVETEFMTSCLLSNETQTIIIENPEKIKMETTPEPSILNDYGDGTTSVEKTVTVKIESVEAPTIPNYTSEIREENRKKLAPAEETSTTLVVNNTLTMSTDQSKEIQINTSLEEATVINEIKSKDLTKNDSTDKTIKKLNEKVNILKPVSSEILDEQRKESYEMQIKSTQSPTLITNNTSDEEIKIEIESDFTKIKNDPIIVQLKELKVENFDPVSESQFSNDTLTEPIKRLSKEIEQDILLNDLNTVAFEEQNTTNIEFTTDNIISNEAQVLTLEEIQKVKIEPTLEPPVFNNNSDISIELAKKLEIESVEAPIIKTSLNNTEIPNTVETELATENPVANNGRSILIKEPEEVLKETVTEPTFINYNPGELVEVPIEIGIVSENSNDTTFDEFKVTDIDTASKSNYTPTLPIEEPENVQIATRVEKQTKVVEIKPLSVTPVSNDTPPTSPVELQKIEMKIATENLFDDTSSVTERTIANKTQEILEIDPKIIETTNNEVPINTNYPLCLTIGYLKNSEEKQIDSKNFPFVTTSNYIQKVPTEVENKMDIEPDCKTLSNNKPITFENSITEMMTNELKIRGIQTIKVEKIEKVNLEVVSTSALVSNFTEQVQEALEKKIETAEITETSNCTTDLFEESPKEILISEKPLSTSILNSISKMSTDVKEEIDTTLGETSKLNNNPPTSVEEINETDNIKTTTETLLANDTTTKSLIKLNIEEMDNTIRHLLSNDSKIAELIKIPHETNINTPSQIQVTNTPDDNIEKAINVKNDYLSTSTVTNNFQTEQREIKTNIVLETLLNDNCNTAITEEPNTVKIKFTTEIPISNDAQSVPNEKTNKVKIETTSKSLVSNENPVLLTENSIEKERESIFVNTLLNDIPDTFVRIEDSEELETQETLKTPVLNNTPDVQKKVEINSISGNPMLNDSASETLKETNKLEIKTVSLAKLSNYSTEQKEIENVSMTIISNDRPQKEGKAEESNAVLNKIVPGHLMGIKCPGTILSGDDNLAVITEELNAVERSTSKFSNDIQNTIIEKSKKAEIDIAPELSVSMNNTVEIVDENIEAEKIKPELLTITSNEEVLPVDDIQNIEIKNVSETLLNDTNIVIKNTAANIIQAIPEKQLNKIETVNETPATKVSLGLTENEPHEVDISKTESLMLECISELIEKTKQINSIPLTVTSDDTPKVLAKVENNTDTHCETLLNKFNTVILEKPKTLETELTTDNLIIGTQSTITVEKTEKVEMGITSEQTSMENINEMNTENITEALFSNNTETLVAISIGEIDTMTNHFTLNDDTQTTLEKSNNVQINDSLSQTLVSNDTPDTAMKTKNTTGFTTMVTNVTLVIPLEETKVIKFDPEILSESVEELNKNKTTTLFTSSISNNAPEADVLVGEKPKETEEHCTLEMCLSNDTSVDPLDEPKKINTVTETLLKNNYNDSLEESNLAKSAEMLTTSVVSSDLQNVFAKKSNEDMEIETRYFTPMLNDTPTTPIGKCNVARILAQKPDETEIILEERMKISLDTTLLNITECLDKQTPDEIQSMFDQLLSENTETIIEETEFMSKISLLNRSDTIVENISKVIDMKNTTFEAPIIIKSESVSNEPLSVETESLDDTLQLLNLTSTLSTDDISETIIPMLKNANCNSVETVQVETPVIKEIITSSKQDNKPNDVEHNCMNDRLVMNKNKIVVEGGPTTETVSVTNSDNDIRDESVNNNLLIENVHYENIENTENVYEQKDITYETVNEIVTVDESAERIVKDTFETNRSNDENSITETILKKIPNVCEENIYDIPDSMLEYGEISKNVLSTADENYSQKKSYGIRELEMSVQRMKTSDDDVEKTFVQLKQTEKLAAQNDIMIGDGNETNNKSNTVNESDLNAILCASSLQEALTVLDSKIKFKLKKNTRNSSDINSMVHKSSRQTSSSSSNEKNSNFTEAREFFKKIEQKSQK